VLGEDVGPAVLVDELLPLDEADELLVPLLLLLLLVPLPFPLAEAVVVLGNPVSPVVGATTTALVTLLVATPPVESVLVATTTVCTTVGVCACPCACVVVPLPVPVPEPPVPDPVAVGPGKSAVPLVRGARLPMAAVRCEMAGPYAAGTAEANQAGGENGW
jgi:hypothetical protein